MKTGLRVTAIIYIFVACFSFSGCGWLFGSTGEEIDAPPQTMAYEAMEEMEAENYRIAAEMWQKLKDRYPYSRYAILAELKMADAMYLSAQYMEGAQAYLDFERLHPNNEAVPYVVFQQGMCYFQQIQGPLRDQTPAVQAIQTFARLREQFPGSKYSAMALAKLTEAQNSLAGHEFEVGNYYYQMGAYKAALGRFVSLIKSYPDTGYHSQALEYIKICQNKLEQMRVAGKLPEEEGPPIDYSIPAAPPAYQIVEPPDLDKDKDKDKNKPAQYYDRSRIFGSGRSN